MIQFSVIGKLINYIDNKNFTLPNKKIEFELDEIKVDFSNQSL